MNLIGLNLLFIACVVLSFLTTNRVRALATRLGAVDLPDARKTHERETPRLGGVAIVLGFALPLTALVFIPQSAELVAKNVGYLLGVLASGSVILLLGIYDDLFGANAPKKFAFQIIAATILLWFGFGFQQISIAGMNFDLGWFGSILTIVWVVGIINAVNFVDGMDSLASFVTLTIALTFVIISAIRGDMFTLVLMVALAGALVGFLPWNLPPARIFMGDTGSMFIGLLLATVAIMRNTKSPATIAVVGPILALALPILDTLFVMRGRFFKPGLRLAERVFAMFNADRQHFHHLLYERYGSHARAVGSIWFLTLLFSVAAVLTVSNATRWWGYGLAIVALILTVMTRAVVARYPEIRHEVDELEELAESWEHQEDQTELQDLKARAGSR
ncbi:MAG: undecaprenyl/decaprenyl-phosphate alpha-N-acetylglucosaminyl 1-phosphate transferase [Acidobacteria bacterium]|nr:undecaprenyl/decaprenyl-phosphate alpha-N-acetylglucosaminyl 1-phosphate transferase [Acidobacteriota bacterium]